MGTSPSIEKERRVIGEVKKFQRRATTQQTSGAPVTSHAAVPPQAQQLVYLQRATGNRAVQTLFRQSHRRPEQSDTHERESKEAADPVTSSLSTPSSGGRRLPAHEMAHVVQQHAAVVSDLRGIDNLPMASPHSAVERSADRAVDAPAGATETGAAPPAICRQAKPHAKINIDLGWLDVSGDGVQTNRQLAAIARLAINSLESDLADVESNSVKAQANEWLQTIKGSLPFFDRHASEPINEDMVPLINHQIDQLAAIRNAILEDKVTRLREALRREQRAAEKAIEEAEALQPKLDDALRAAYRKGSKSSVKETVSAVKSALSIGRNLRALAEGITTDILSLPVPKGKVMTVDRWSSQIGQVKITIINVSKYTDMLAKLGRGLTVINIALTIADRSKRATDVEQGMKDLNDAVNISTDLASLSPVSLPPHVSLMTTLWIKPALKVITKQISMLVEQLSDINRTSVAVTGDLMYPEAEPGGQAMFDLMVAVMHASDASGVPEIRGRVEAYLYDHREKLEAGAEESVPTSGWWFWEDLDSKRARTWLFSHRQRVWAMFYGSMQVPSRSRR
jgi:hypothetical protein